MSETGYDFSLKIRDKEIKFRKWKVKDRKNFITALKNNDRDGVERIVFDCIEKQVPLTEEEFKYVMMNIRSVSIGEDLAFNIDCEQCEEEFSYITPVTEAITPNFKEFGVIKSGNFSLKMGEIANKEYYEDAIRQCRDDEEKAFIDFLYHVKEINGSDAFTFDKLYNTINELDIGIGEDIFRQWEEMRFTFDTVKQLECPHCNHLQFIKFDELYGFFPDSWFL